MMLAPDHEISLDASSPSVTDPVDPSHVVPEVAIEGHTTKSTVGGPESGEGGSGVATSIFSCGTSIKDGQPVRPPTTPDGRVIPAACRSWGSRFSSSVLDYEKLKQLVKSEVLTPEDGALKGVWILTIIDHWDNNHERVVVVTERNVLMIKYNFLYSSVRNTTRIPLADITRIQVGNLVAPPWSLMGSRDYGGMRVVWGPEDSVGMLQRWNPLCRSIPYTIFHYHPLYYAMEYEKEPAQKDKFDVNFFYRALIEAVSIQPTFEDIQLESYSNVAGLIFNQSNLGYCKDRNGVRF